MLAPDQSGLASGEQRFVMSLRAVGEGHMSSIEFRSGVLDAERRARASIEPGAYLVGGQRTPPRPLRQARFSAKLRELGASNELSVERAAAARRPVHARRARGVAERAGGARPAPAIWFETAKIIRVLASSNYVTTFPPTRSSPSA